MSSPSPVLDMSSPRNSPTPGSPEQPLDLELAAAEPPLTEFDGNVLNTCGKDVQKKRRKFSEDCERFVVSPEETGLEMNTADDSGDIMQGFSQDIFFAGGDMDRRREASKEDQKSHKDASSFLETGNCSSNKKKRSEGKVAESSIFPSDFNTATTSYVVEQQLKLTNEKEVCLDRLKRLSLKVECNGPPGMLLSNVLAARKKMKQLPS
eukprot:752431-Hanusia_phi.AAC.5